MSQSPLELWSDAQTLPETTEAQRRTKISRCYYALYSHACEFSQALPSEGLLYKSGSGMHKQLIQKLTNPTVMNRDLIALSRKIGTQQMLAYDLRLKADYRLNEDVTPADVRKCVSFVRQGMQVPLPTSAAA